MRLGLYLTVITTTIAGLVSEPALAAKSSRGNQTRVTKKTLPSEKPAEPAALEVVIDTWVPFKPPAGEEWSPLESNIQTDILDFPAVKRTMELTWDLGELRRIPNLTLECPEVALACTAEQLTRLVADYPVMVFDAGHNESPAANRTEPPGSGTASLPSGAPALPPEDDEAEPATPAVARLEEMESKTHARASRFLHEGRGNTVQVLLAKRFAEKCLLSRLPAPQRPAIHLTRYPLEKYFGDFEAPAWKNYVEQTLGYPAPYIASELHFESIPFSPERLMHFKKTVNNFLLPLNHRTAYANYLLAGSPEQFEQHRTREFFPWGLAPSDTDPEGEDRFEEFLPPFNVRESALFVSFHSDTANRRKVNPVDAVSVFYSRMPPDRVPTIAELTAKPATEANPELHAMASQIATSIQREQKPYFTKIRDDAGLVKPGAVLADWTPIRQLRAGKFLLLHGTRARHAFIVESFDTTGRARGHMERLVQNHVGELEVRLLDGRVGVDARIYPIYPLALAAAKGFTAALANAYCAPPVPVVPLSEPSLEDFGAPSEP